ncbi:MAG TPA: hypothetical protein VGK24_09305 [Candidatus Angelobacter sp.]|jgi:hypothetical protein
MRITVNLDDDVASLLKQYARRRRLSLKEAVAELVNLGTRTPLPTRVVNGLLVFDPGPHSPRVKTSTVRKLEAEEY